MKYNKTRLLYLDAIRGIAALMVVFSHYAERTPLHNFIVFKFFTPGQFGVVVFFLLSGFVIPYSIKEGSGWLQSFVVSRFFRLYPTYWVSIFLAVISAAFFIKAPLEVNTVIANLTMIQKLLGFADAFGVYWTLLVELFFYFICVLAAWFGVLSKLKGKFYLSVSFLLLGGITAVVRHLSGIALPVGIVVSISMMFFGSIWREVVVNKSTRAKVYSSVWVLLFVVIFPIVSFMVYDFDRGLGENAYSYIVSFFTGLAFFLLFTTRIKIECKTLTLLGVVSYSIYLMHPFVLEFINYVVDLHKGFNFLIFILYVALTLILSSCTYLLIEKPSINAGRYMKSLIYPKL